MVHRIVLNIGAAAWVPFIAHVVPDAFRGRYFGHMRRAMRLAALAATVLAGWYLGKDPPLNRFYILFAALLVLNAMRPVLFRALPDPPPARNGKRENVLRSLRRPLHDPRFTGFAVFWAVLLMIRCTLGPFMVPFLKTELNFPSSTVVYVTSGTVLGGVLSLVGWGRLTDRWGNRGVFLVCTGLSVVCYLLLGITPGYAAGGPIAIVLAFAAFLLRFSMIISTETDSDSSSACQQS